MKDQLIHILPAVNATLNGTSAILLVSGYLLMRVRRIRAHAVMMISAVGTSTAFLFCYLLYHGLAGERSSHFPACAIRPVYLGILLSHTLLAMAILPMVGTTLWRVRRRQWDRHRRIARWTFPVWLYVSVTGVVIYWMLYHLAPGLA